MHAPPNNVLRQKTPHQISSILLDKWTKEITLISEHFIGKSNQLEFINLQVPLSLFSSNSDAHIALELFGKMKQLNTHVVGSHTKFGLDFNTSMLSSNIEHTMVDNILKQIGLLASRTNDVPFSCATIATNIHTFHNAQHVSRGLLHYIPEFEIMATEILRCDMKRPGQISTNFEYYPAHRLEKIDDTDLIHVDDEQMKNFSPEERQLIRNIHQATMDFKRALDICIQTEKILLEKVCCLV